MQVKSVMRRCGRQAERTTPIAAIARMMGEGGTRTLPVTEEGRFIGLVCDWDISCQAVMADREIALTTAGDGMALRQAHCTARTELGQAIALMDRAGARCLAVIDGRQRLVGMLHRDDVGGATQ